MVKCVTLDDSNGKFFYKKGKLEMELGDPEAAEKSMVKAKSLDNTLTIDNELKQLSKKVKELNKKDFYGALGLTKDATIDQIKKAYKELVRKWHPDKHANNPETKEKADKKFKEINEAYTVLSDPKKKQQYDLMGGSSQEDFDGNFGGFSHHPTQGMGGVPMSQVFQMFFNQGSNNAFSFGNMGTSSEFEDFTGFPFGGGMSRGAGQKGNQRRR